MRKGVADLGLGLVEATGGGDGAEGCGGGAAVAHGEGFGFGDEDVAEFCIDGFLDVDAVGGYAGLACVAPFQCHECCGGSLAGDTL